MRISIRVRPGASRTHVGGSYDGALIVAVSQRAVDGKATEAALAAVARPGLLERAAAAGLRSLFVGFETLAPANLRAQHKTHNLTHDYTVAIRRLHDLGVMVNASFVFGLDGDDETVFDRTVDWAIAQGVETATFHVLTPYPGTALYERLAAEGRILTRDWDLYDTRHAVFSPARMSAQALEAGYWRAYERFYRWGSVVQAASTKPGWAARLRHVAYTGGWKKADRLWDLVIRGRRLASALPLLERVLRTPAGLQPGRPDDYARLPAASDRASIR